MWDERFGHVEVRSCILHSADGSRCEVNSAVRQYQAACVLVSCLAASGSFILLIHIELLRAYMHVKRSHCECDSHCAPSHGATDFAVPVLSHISHRNDTDIDLSVFTLSFSLSFHLHTHDMCRLNALDIPT